MAKLYPFAIYLFTHCVDIMDLSICTQYSIISVHLYLAYLIVLRPLATKFD